MDESPHHIPHWTTRGTLTAIILIALWTACLVALLTLDLTQLSATQLALVPAGIALQTFLYTGLFITAHDAMHGIVAPRHPRLNDLLGALSVALYALFSFPKMRAAHHLHHKHPGQPHHDPDFHDGQHTGFFAWYVHFVRAYLSLPQLVGMALVFNLLEHIAHVPVTNLLLFWVAPALLSTLQLFFFGTYLPHRGQHANPHNARSNDLSPTLSFLTCYHFGYHLEHHTYPWAPWWYLPRMRKR